MKVDKTVRIDVHLHELLAEMDADRTGQLSSDEANEWAGVIGTMPWPIISQTYHTLYELRAQLEEVDARLHTFLATIGGDVMIETGLIAIATRLMAYEQIARRGLVVNSAVSEARQEFPDVPLADALFRKPLSEQASNAASNGKHGKRPTVTTSNGKAPLSNAERQRRFRQRKTKDAKAEGATG